MREIPRSMDSCSKAGMIPAAVKVVIMALKATRKRLIFFYYRVNNAQQDGKA